MTFFSDHKLQHLSKQLQNNKVEELLGQITSLVQSRLPRHDTASAKPLQLATENRGVVLDVGEAAYYLEGEYCDLPTSCGLPLCTVCQLSLVPFLETLTLTP